MMYTPRHFSESDLQWLDALVSRDSFATLVTTDPDGTPCISHLPVLYRRDGERVLVEGHWARPNPQARHAGPALLIVHGPHAYLSPGWYPDKESAARVPTWNYAVAHLHGTLSSYDDTAALADLVTRLSDHFEATVGNAWSFDPARDEHARQLRGIVGFRLEVERVELKAKFSQNHPVANVAAAAEALERIGGEQRHEVAAQMRALLARREATQA